MLALINQGGFREILEIGCGEGILLQELSKKGFNVQGIEPSEAASERVRKKNMGCVTGYFPDSRLRGPFDAVVMAIVDQWSIDGEQVYEKYSSNHGIGD